MIKHKEQAEPHSSMYSELPLQKWVTDLRNIKFKTKFKVVFHLRSSVIWGHLSFEVICHLRLCSIRSCLNFYVLLDWGPYFIWGHLLLKVVFQQRSSSNGGCIPWRSSSIGGIFIGGIFIGGRFTLEVVIHWNSNVIGCCPLSLVLSLLGLSLNFEKHWTIYSNLKTDTVGGV